MIAPACGRADGVFSEQYAIFLQNKKKQKNPEFAIHIIFFDKYFDY